MHTEAYKAQSVAIYASIHPPQTDDSALYPFQLETEPSNSLQIRISLDLLENPTELDPVYIAIELTSEQRLESAITTKLGDQDFFFRAHFLPNLYVENYTLYNFVFLDFVSHQERSRNQEESDGGKRKVEH